MTIRFYLKHKRSDGFKKLMFVLSDRSVRKQIYTDFYIDPTYWSQSKQIHKDKLVNDYIQSIQDRFSSIRTNAVRLGHRVNVDYYQDHYENNIPEPEEEEDDISFISYFGSYHRKMKNKRSWDYIRKTIPISQHLTDSGLNPTFENMTLNFWNNYMDYMIEEGLSNNTMNDHRKFIRLICKDALKNNIKVNMEFYDFKIKTYQTKPIWLNWDEVDTIANAHLIGDEKIIVDDFLLRTYTSLRNSDMVSVKKHHFHQQDDVWYLSIHVQKTQRVLTIPIHIKAMKILLSYDFNIPQFSLQHKNREIKLILRKLGINRMVERVRFVGNQRIVDIKELCDVVSTHTARRTFGRKFMEETRDIHQLCEILGQTDTKTTMIYIGWDNIELGKTVSNLSF